MKQCKVLIFNLNSQKYALDIEEVERIVSCNNITRLIDSEFYVDGIVEYEGGTLTVINLYKIFDMEEVESLKDEKIIVIINENLRIGVKVDYVIEVASIDESLIEQAPPLALRNERTPIKGIIKEDKEIIVLLDGKKIFRLDKVKVLM